MIDNYPVRQLPDGTWQEQVNGTWYGWDERPLCECEITDVGGPESGPDPVIAVPNLACPRHAHEFTGGDA